MTSSDERIESARRFSLITSVRLRNLDPKAWALGCARAGRRRKDGAQLNGVNAAIHLKNRAVNSTVSAWGEEGSGRARKGAAKPAPPPIPPSAS